MEEGLHGHAGKPPRGVEGRPQLVHQLGEHGLSLCIFHKTLEEEQLEQGVKLEKGLNSKGVPYTWSHSWSKVFSLWMRP